jgi:two-component system, chemotaxis family, protein-glutamate methylesterase/glutaminase
MGAGRRIRILIVDDSVVMRSLLRNVVGADSGLEVVASAADGESALRIVETARPDLILLDVEMPVMDGLATLRELRARGHKMPVIMCSSLTQHGAAVTVEALAGGASDYVAKPSGQAGREAALNALSQDLIPKIHGLTAPSHAQPTHVFPGLASGIGSRPFPGSVGIASGSVNNPARLHLPPPAMSPYRAQTVTSIPVVLTIGVSTGGPAALDRILPELPASFPLPVLVVQHMPESFTRIFAERLDGRCRLRVREAADGD